MLKPTEREIRAKADQEFYDSPYWQKVEAAHKRIKELWLPHHCRMAAWKHAFSMIWDDEYAKLEGTERGPDFW